MTQNFGASLRAERERRQVALSAIAEETKIKASLLESLEHDDLSCWPDGLFRRAYVRAYASAVGLEPERVIREFLEQYPEPVEPPPAEPAPSARRFLSAPIATMSALLGRTPRTAPPTATADHGTPTSALEDVDAVLAESRLHLEPAAAPNPFDLSVDLSARPQPAAELGGSSVGAESGVAIQELAYVCTRLGRLADHRGLSIVLDDAARLVDAAGLVVWSWNAHSSSLRASLASGYSDDVIAQLPPVSADAPNAVAAAFRTRDVSIVTGGPGLAGAVAVPMMAPGGCVGVLAVELRNGNEHQETVHAVVAILAAQLVTLVGSLSLAEAVA